MDKVVIDVDAQEADAFSFRFFARELREDIDYMVGDLFIDPDSDEATIGYEHQAIPRLAERARVLLEKRTSLDVINMVYLLDALAEPMIDSLHGKSVGSESRQLTREDLLSIDPVSVLPLAADYCGGKVFRFPDFTLEGSPQEYCAAYALVMLAAVLRVRDNDWMATIGVNYALQAAQALGAADVFLRKTGADKVISIDFRVRVQREIAYRANQARWKSDPTQKLKEEVLSEWVLWRSNKDRYKNNSAFRKAMLVRYPDAVDGTLKNWMSKWTSGLGPLPSRE